VFNEPSSRGAEAEVVRSLRVQRIKQGLSMNRVAKMAGLSQQMVSYVERGMRHPTLDTLLRIADALDVDLWRVLKSASDTGKTPLVDSD
jgi:transcriptional regulator with XRE-family HTH domain